MKKILLAMMISIMSLASFAQTINISTGVNNTGVGQTEANSWKVSNPSIGSGITPYTVASYGSYWQPTPVQGCNARWINPTASVSTQTPGYYIFERVINVPASGIKTLALKFQLAWDDVLTSLELVPPTGASIPLSFTAASPKAYFLGNPVETKQDVCGRTGNWILRAKVQYVDQLGGFMLCGNADLIKGICCDCPIPNTNVNFSICSTLGGGTTATASALGASTGLGNGWTLKQVPCPSTNPCKWLPGGIKWMSTGSAITIPSSVLTPGCYVLTHYVNRCSKQWDPKQCVSYRSICFTICDNAITAAQDVNPTMLMRKKSVDGEQLELDEVEREAEIIVGKN